MGSLGEKIKKRRKQLKLTLKELAGNDFSYSLLSQIENNKAKPSIATLEKLAEKLAMPVNELINPAEIAHYRSLLSEFEKLTIMPYDRNPAIDKHILETIEPLLSTFQYTCYEEARLAELYSKSYFYYYGEIRKPILEKSMTYYEQIGLTHRKYKTQLFICAAFINQGNYKETQELLEEIVREVEKEEYVVEPMIAIDSYYYKSLIEAAAGAYLLAATFCMKALEIIKRTNLYYKTDAILRFQLLLYIQLQHEEQGRTNLKKLYHYVQFTENIYDYTYYMYSKAHFENRLQLNTQIIKELLHFIKSYLNREEGELSTLYKQELAYAYWKEGLYEEALSQVKDYEIPAYVTHPLERSAGFEIIAVRAECLYKVGNEEEAIEDIVYSRQQVKNMPDSTYKETIYRIYDAILKKG